MTAEEDALRLFYHIYYTINLVVALFLNCLLLYLMKVTKSSLLKNMQLYLLNTTIFDILVSLSAYFAQCRPVANEITLAVFCHGPCKYFGPWGCFVAFALVQCAVISATFSILLAFYYRYRLLEVEIYKNYRHARNFIIFSLLPIAMFLFQMFAESDFAKVELEVRQLHPNYDYENNALFGYSNSRGVGSLIAQLMIAIGVYIVPLIAFYYRRKINKILSVSTQNRIPITYCKQLITGLMYQTLLPFFIYCPAYSYFLYAQYTGQSNIFAEYIVNIAGSLISVFNPILTIHFVLPYRKAVQNFFCQKKTRKVEEVTNTDFPSIRHPTLNNHKNRPRAVATISLQTEYT